MKVTPSGIQGLTLIEPTLYGDERGYFFESYSSRVFEDIIGEEILFVQDNESRSSLGVLRGLHFQEGVHAQAKLVRVVSGAVWDVAVDLRRESESYGSYYGVELTGDNHLQLFIPRGFAHGFLTLSETAILQYKCDNYYHPESEGGIIWNDPTLDIPWCLEKIKGATILSQKDALLRTFDQYKNQRQQ